MFFKKRSQLVIGTQITILFSIIAGAFILIFFFTIGTSAKRSADLELDYNLIMEMKTLLDGLKSNDGVVQKNATMPKELEFYNACEGFYLEDMPKINNDYIFAPDKLRGRGFYFYTTQVEMPFYINSILLISTNQINNIFLSDNNIHVLEELLNPSEELSFPEFNNKILSTNKISAENDLKEEIYRNDIETRFIYFNNPHSGINVKDNLEATLTDIQLNKYEGEFYFIFLDDDYNLDRSSAFDKLNAVNHIEYYKYNKKTNQFVSQGDVYTYSRNLLHAALISDDYFTYNCKLQQIQEDYKRISRVYIAKTESIIENIDETITGTKIYYSLINESLHDLNNYFTHGIITQDDASDINDAIKTVERNQEKLLGSSEVSPLIY